MQVSFNDIVEIYEREIKINTKNKKKIYQFELFKMENLIDIYNCLTNNCYKDIKYNIFMVKDPKYRIVMSLSIKDKIVNHYATRYILIPKLEKLLDIRNVATRKNMGRDYGIKLVKKYMNKYKTGYVLKIDISKYFYSIDHNVLKNMLKEYLTDEEYDIMNVILDSTNAKYINEEIKKLKNSELKKNKRIDEIVNIPYYKYNKGIPIGNLTSQFLAIWYLYKIHHYVIHHLHFKHMVIYMDDYIIFSDSKDKLKFLLKYLSNTLNDEYHLKLNKNKTHITSLKNGFTFCGYHFFKVGNKTIVKVCLSTRKRVKKRIKEVKYLYDHDKLNFNSTFSSVMTYYYGFKYGSKKKIRRIIDKYFFGQEELVSPNADNSNNAFNVNNTGNVNNNNANNTNGVRPADKI